MPIIAVAALLVLLLARYVLDSPTPNGYGVTGQSQQNNPNKTAPKTYQEER